MKKIPQLVLFLAVTNMFTLFVLLSSCGGSVEKVTTPCTNCYSGVNCGDNFPGINGLLAKEMVQYYKENQLLQVNNAMFNNTVSRNDATGTPVNYHNTDARCVWFDLKTLKRFIYEIESQTCRACGSSDTLGIRMYYGSYPGSPEEWNEKYGGNLANMCHEYAQKHTLLMVPTIRKTGIDIDFDPQYMSTSCDPVAGWNRIDSMMLANKSLSLLMLSTLDVGAQNHGTLSPPPYDNVDASVTRQFYGTAFMNLVDDVPNTGEVLTQRCP